MTKAYVGEKTAAERDEHAEDDEDGKNNIVFSKRYLGINV